MRIAYTLSALCLIACSCQLANGATHVTALPPASTLPLQLCGEMPDAPPRVPNAWEVPPRQCPAPVPRSYVSRYQGLGYEVLNLESEACFVPDDSFRLLDSLIDQAVAHARGQQAVASGEAAAIATFSMIGTLLVDNGFQLRVGTHSLADALQGARLPQGGKYVTDCDTSSLIYLSIAEQLKVQANLVEITLFTGAGHNYLRASTADGATVDWDTNGRTQCATPQGLPDWQGKTMSRQEVLGYVTLLRGITWDQRGAPAQALADYRTASQLYPSSPTPANNLAWVVATNAAFGTPALLAEATAAANKAVMVQPSAMHLDTLACVQARVGDFPSAIATQTAALNLLSGADDRTEYEAHLAAFRATPPGNCVPVR